jgi:hypothetical protein
MSTLKYIGIICICLIGIQGISQTGKEQTKKEQKEAQRVAFLSEKLELTPEEAEKFWPVYREFKKASLELRKLDRPKRSGVVADMTDEEMETLLDAMLAYKQKELDLKKKYHEKFKEILPIRKVAKLYHAEEQFRKVKKRPNSSKPSGSGSDSQNPSEKQ